MATQNVVIDYSDEKDNDLKELATIFHLSLTGNPHFITLADRLEGFKDRIDDFEQCLFEASTNDSIKIFKKNESRKILLKEIHDLAQEVNRISNGDLTKLLSTRLPLTKEREPVGPLEAPTDLKVVNGPNPGEIWVSVDSHDDAIMYFFYIATVPAPEDIDDWKLKHSTRCKNLFKGFKSGSQLAVKAAYRGTNDELNYSNTVYIYVQ